MSVSSDVLSGDDHSTVVSSHHGGGAGGAGQTRRHAHFPYAYLKSKLSTLPEELDRPGGGGQIHRYQWTQSQVRAAHSEELYQLDANK